MHFGIWWVVSSAVVCAAERWQWPEPAASVRIDTKVRFIDDDRDTVEAAALQDDAPFHPAPETEGFYSRGGSAGRYPVRVETAPHERYLHLLGKNYDPEEAPGGAPRCRCEPRAACAARAGAEQACGVGQTLCCYSGPSNTPAAHNSEYFNEIEDERPALLPGKEEPVRPFPPVPEYKRDHVLAGPGGPTGHIGPGHDRQAQGVLVGPQGPTGHIGPVRSGTPAILVGPSGPTGNIGPGPAHTTVPAVLVGPEGPTGVIGPHGSLKRNPDVLVGPQGPTGVVGPVSAGHRDVGPSETAQRGVLVGPGGPTGIIGPRGYAQRPVLVGPGGPTGIIGPRGGLFNDYYGRRRNPGVLVGPGGPTGSIGPGRQLLVGPGGPTGQIGPHRFFV